MIRVNTGVEAGRMLARLTRKAAILSQAAAATLRAKRSDSRAHWTRPDLLWPLMHRD